MNEPKHTPVAEPAQTGPAEHNPYAVGADISELAKRLAATLNTSPFALWSEREMGELRTGLSDVMAHMARSQRAQRLAVAFAHAVDGGMPAATQMLVLVDWAAVVLPAFTGDARAAVLRDTRGLAHTVAAAPQPAAFPGIDGALERLDYGPERDNTHRLHGLEAVARGAIDCFVHPAEQPTRCAPAFDAWLRATDALGFIEQVLQDAEAAFAKCERILAEHIYPWARSMAQGNHD